MTFKTWSVLDGVFYENTINAVFAKCSIFDVWKGFEYFSGKDSVTSGSGHIYLRNH